MRRWFVQLNCVSSDDTFSFPTSVFGKLSNNRFQKLSGQYEAEQIEIKMLASVLEREIEDDAKQAVDVEQFLHLAERYS